MRKNSKSTICWPVRKGAQTAIATWRWFTCSVISTSHEMRNEVQTSRQKTPVPEGNGRRSQEIKRYPSMVKRGSPAYHRGEERESSWSQRSRPSEESKSIGVGKRSRKAVERNSKWP